VLLRVVTPEDLIPLFAMVTTIVLVVVAATTFTKVAKYRIDQGAAGRLQGRGGMDPEVQSELAELREQVADLAHRVAEGEERLDFTERLLTRGHEETKPHE
jgi:hypothetical protein